MTTYLKLNNRREKIEALIKNYVYSPLGVDINNIEELPPQMELTEYDIYQGLMLFYAHHPITNVISKDLILRTNGIIDLNLAKPNSEDSWEFIGIKDDSPFI